MSNIVPYPLVKGHRLQATPRDSDLPKRDYVWQNVAGPMHPATPVVEKQVISLYDAGLLTADILAHLVLPLCNHNVETRSSSLRTKDGKSFRDIVIDLRSPMQWRCMYIASQKRYIEAAVDPEMLFGENGGRHRYQSDGEYRAARVAFYDLEEDENMAFDRAIQRIDE